MSDASPSSIRQSVRLTNIPDQPAPVSDNTRLLGYSRRALLSQSTVACFSLIAPGMAALEHQPLVGQRPSPGPLAQGELQYSGASVELRDSGPSQSRRGAHGTTKACRGTNEHPAHSPVSRPADIPWLGVLLARASESGQLLLTTCWLLPQPRWRWWLWRWWRRQHRPGHGQNPKPRSLP